ncbi:MAG: NBR1-Ig-like domain-containing protein [Anaerolineales bacterium]
MDKSNHHIVCALFLTVILCACGSGTSSPSNHEASITAAGMTAVQITSLFVMSPTSTLSRAPQESPILSPTFTLSLNPTRPPIRNVPACYDSLFLEDVTIPDGTIMAPEENFVKTWKFKNTGTCGWTTSFAIGFSYGNLMNGNDTALPNSVDTGDSVDIAVDMTAPKTTGWYAGWWRLKNESGLYFGDFVYVSILVSNGQETSTPIS